MARPLPRYEICRVEDTFHFLLGCRNKFNERILLQNVFIYRLPFLITIQESNIVNKSSLSIISCFQNIRDMISLHCAIIRKISQGPHAHMNHWAVLCPKCPIEKLINSLFIVGKLRKFLLYCAVIIGCTNYVGGVVLYYFDYAMHYLFFFTIVYAFEIAFPGVQVGHMERAPVEQTLPLLVCFFCSAIAECNGGDSVNA